MNGCEFGAGFDSNFAANFGAESVTLVKMTDQKPQSAIMRMPICCCQSNLCPRTNAGANPTSTLNPNTSATNANCEIDRILTDNASTTHADRLRREQTSGTRCRGLLAETPITLIIWEYLSLFVHFSYYCEHHFAAKNCRDCPGGGLVLALGIVALGGYFGLVGSYHAAHWLG